MKRILTLLLLVTIFTTGQSFKIKRKPHADQFKNEGYIQAIVDGKIFEVRDDNKYTADLKSKSNENSLFAANTGGKITRVATAVNFYGSDFKDEDGNNFTESIGFEYTFADGATGDAADQRITLNYNNQKYYNILGESKMKITKMTWSPDRRYFTINADFDCKMRRWGVPAATQPVIRMKGKMEGITVTVPSWIVLKGPGQTAER